MVTEKVGLYCALCGARIYFSLLNHVNREHDMAGTKEGGQKVKAKLLARNPDHYKQMGALGGTKSRGGGFASMSKGKLQEVSSRGGKAKRQRQEEEDDEVS